MYARCIYSLLGCWAAAASLLAPWPVCADSFAVVYSFTGAPADGAYPIGNLVADSSGNLFAVTQYGGDSSACGVGIGCGTLYEFDPAAAQDTVLHSFCSSRSGNCRDGALPQAGVAVDKNGSLLGTTFGVDQSPSKQNCSKGCGNLYIINGNDREKVLVQFEGKTGEQPAAPPLKLNGHIYGTTFSGGACGGGTLYEVPKPGDQPVILHSFCSGATDGYYPYGPLTTDRSGTVYGTTVEGGAQQSGTVFSLATGDNSFAVRYAFCTQANCADGTYPYGGVILDDAGNMYGTTQFGGTNGNCKEPDGCGTVFRLTPGGTETILHAFAGEPDGAFPFAGVLMDKRGNFYGTTENGGGSDNGCLGGCGVVFKLAADGTETVLHALNRPTDGANPFGGLTELNGYLYGTASLAGPGNLGVIFRLKK